MPEFRTAWETMSLVSLVAIYFVVWWVVLFAVLPWGVRTQEEEGDIVLGTAHSAPARPLLLRKALATTIVSGIIVFGFWLAVERYGFTLEWVADLVFPVGNQP
jgi:predicted secreted protein